MTNKEISKALLPQRSPKSVENMRLVLWGRRTAKGSSLIGDRALLTRWCSEGKTINAIADSILELRSNGRSFSISPVSLQRTLSEMGLRPSLGERTRHSPWAAEEIGILDNMIKRKESTTAMLTSLPGRSIRGILDMVYRRQFHPHAKTEPRWCADEKKRLRDLKAENLPTLQIARIMGRSIPSIKYAITRYWYRPAPYETLPTLVSTQKADSTLRK
jgi:hypothetical protein